MSKEFKVGDIVYYKAGRIGNGKYGSIDFGPDNTLCVLDNEGAPDMDVKGNEALLEVVGNIDDNIDLLNEHIYQDPLYSIEDLRSLYIEYQIDINTNFDEIIKEMKANARFLIKQEAFENKVLKTVKNIYPEYIYRWRNAEDGGRLFEMFNVEEEKIEECREVCHNVIDVNDPTHEFDSLIHVVNKKITERHYSQVLENKGK